MRTPDSITTRADVGAAIFTSIESIAQRFHLAEVYVFGSRAGEIAARLIGAGDSADAGTSDVDIGVHPERGVFLTIEEKVKLSIELEDLFHAPRVDLLVISEVDTWLAAEIIRGELLYCIDPDEQAESELYFLRRAGDLAYFERERVEGIISGELS